MTRQNLFARWACVAGLAGLPAPALAHAFLQAAQPAVGSTVRTAPTQVTIDFTEGVEPAFSSIVVTGPDGRVDDGKPAHLDGGDTRLAVGLRHLKPGAYVVTWHAVAIDTHHTQGTFRFTVAP